MSSLADRIAADLTAAMKRKEASVVDPLRMLRAAIKNTEIDKGHELGDEEIISVIRTMEKQLKDAMHQFEEGKRQDLVDKSATELSVLSGYLPPGISDEELATIIDRTIASLGASGQKDFGKVMGAVVKEVQGSADGSRISAAVKARLVE